jgi:hypothetical protein
MMKGKTTRRLSLLFIRRIKHEEKRGSNYLHNESILNYFEEESKFVFLKQPLPRENLT